MEFRILGPVEAVHAGLPLALGGPRHRRLLAALLLHAGDVVPAWAVIRALWGDTAPRSAQAMLHVRISELRAALRPAAPELITRAGGYMLKVGPDDLDAWRFERLCAAGAAALAAGEPARARAHRRVGAVAGGRPWRSSPMSHSHGSKPHALPSCGCARSKIGSQPTSTSATTRTWSRNWRRSSLVTRSASGSGVS